MAGSPIPGGGGKVVLNFKGMGELLRSDAMGLLLRSRMAPVQSALPGSTLETRKRRSRIAAIVARGSDYDEANTGDLSRALDLSGGQRGTQVKLSKPRRRSNG
jgi:hypothetical protein